MADSGELQANFTEYRAQLQRVSFFWSELRELVRLPLHSFVTDRF